MHPELEEVLAEAYQLGFGHVVLITNGKRIADEDGFADRLAMQFPDLEVYLQFDSLDPKVLVEIRGSDMAELRHRSMAALESAGLQTTLVAVVKHGRSLDALPDVVSFSLEQTCVRGITFQPLRASGRHSEEPRPGTAPTASEIVRSLSERGGLPEWGFMPHPLAPENITVGYFDRTTFAPETSQSLECDSPKDAPLLLLPPDRCRPRLFRTLIVTYLDKFNVRNDLLAEAPIHLLHPDGGLVPLDAHYLFGSSPDEVGVVTLRSPA
jgi:uncharacterized radical SAM superfamily Fe-S cluster-containing enzyme